MISYSVIFLNSLINRDVRSLKIDNKSALYTFLNKCSILRFHKTYFNNYIKQIKTLSVIIYGGFKIKLFFFLSSFDWH